jgi:glycosyltransferase involved in cell wall biosynthesis
LEHAGDFAEGRRAVTLTVLLDLSFLATPEVSRGVRRYAHLLALALHQRQKPGELNVLALAETPLFGPARASSDIPACIEAAERGRTQGLRGVFGARLRNFLGEAARSTQADVIHSLLPEGSPRRALDRPRIVTCHHLDSSVAATEWHGGSGRIRLDRRHFHRADRVIAISRATAQELIARLDIPRSKIAVVYNGIDEQVWSMESRPDDPQRLAALGLRGQPYLLCVGAVDARKNVEGVMRGLGRAHLLAGHRQLALVWAGQLARAERQELEAQARRAGVLASLKTVGFVSDADLACLYRSATALVFTSRREGFGYPVVEAMASGCPVVTSNCSSLIEVAEHAALTVDPEDSEAIADAIVLLQGDRREIRRLTADGLLRAREFRLERMVEGTLTAYRDARDGTRSPSARPSAPP